MRTSLDELLEKPNTETTTEPKKLSYKYIARATKRTK